MRQRTYLLYRILAVWMALTFLPVLLSVSPAPEKRPTDRGTLSEQRIPHPELDRLTELALAEELLPYRPARTFRAQAHKGTGGQRTFQLCFGAFWLLLITVCILYRIRRLFWSSLRYSRSYIIRYIHDQDGRKRCYSVF